MDQKFIELFDRFTHGAIKRRDFLEKLTALTGSAAAANTVFAGLENNYASAATIPEDDPRLRAGFQKFETDVAGYLAVPLAGDGHPGVLVIHENRGLNAHIKDVTRRLALEGFVVFAPDYLFSKGGTPDDPDKARNMIGTLTPEEILRTSMASLNTVNKHLANKSKQSGAVGFCWGGGQVNRLAVADPSLKAAVVYYGEQPPAEDVPKITAALLLHYAGLDDRINSGIPAFEAALKASNKIYELHMYEGVNHAFNNDTNAARYNKEAADLAWGRTVAFLKKHLG